jgi:hypothetical protein
MRLLRVGIVYLALGPGLFMTFDGARALIAGDYLTPTTGQHAGQLGPWSSVVSAIGIPPRSTGMKVAFVLFGLAWLTAAVAFLRRAPGSRGALAGLAVATLWYLPVGTLVSALVLVGLALPGARLGNPQPQGGVSGMAGS